MQSNNANVLRARSCLRLQLLDITRVGPNKIVFLAQNLSQTDRNRQGIFVTNDNHRVQITVSGVWTTLEFARGQIILVEDVSPGPEANHFIIDNTKGLIIIEPDNLIACTAVTSGLFCERKTWLDHVFSKCYQTSRGLLVGKLIHHLFLQAIKFKTSDRNLLIKQLDGMLCNESVMMEIYAAAWNINTVRNACLEYVRTIAHWVDNYMLPTGVASGYSTLANDKNIAIRLRETCDIEDLMRSHNYGLKGKVDVVGNFRIYNKQRRRFRDEQRAVLEVKTGMSRLCRNHTAQVELYHMISETSDVTKDKINGYLTYLKPARPILYQIDYPSHNVKRDLCMKRNKLNTHFKDYFLGPATLERASSCTKCERLTECQLMGKIYDLDEEKFPHMALLERESTGHLDEKFINFFARHHERLTRLIHGNCNQTSSKWSNSTCVATDREQGFPIRLLQLEADGPNRRSGQDWQVCFVRSRRFIENFLTSAIGKHRQAQSQPDPKKVKLEHYLGPSPIQVIPFEFKGNLHLHCRVSIKLDRDVGEQSLEGRDHQVVTGTLCDLKSDKLTIKLSQPRLGELLDSNVIYRLDRLAPQRCKSADLELMRQVLVLLLGRDGRREVRLRKLVSDPDYKPQQNQELSVSLQMTEYLGLTELQSEWEPLVFEAVATNNYFVISERLVKPKNLKLNKLVSAMVEVMISLERRVLIVAQDVDSLIGLMNSLKEICKFILLNDPSQSPPSKAQFHFASNIVRLQDQATATGESLVSVVEKYNAFIRAHELAPVIVTTFHTSRNNLLLAKQTFDYCIAYDCDKTEPLICLAPMFSCDRHIIIDIDDGQCASGGGSSHNYCDNLATSLGEHLRNLRPELYEARAGENTLSDCE